MAGQSASWSSLKSRIVPLLANDDDEELWAIAVETIYTDVEALTRAGSASQPISTVVGRCSHWLRPHQTRWTADGGFAWPSGYDGPAHSLGGLPEFDWSCRWHWSATAGWEPASADKVSAIGEPLFRVAVPSRTTRHRQAAVHTVWLPGSPQHPRVELTQFYGFRKQPEGWACTAYRAHPDEGSYEATTGPKDRIVAPGH